MSLDSHAARLDIETVIINGQEDRTTAHRREIRLRAEQGQALRATLVACTKEIVGAIDHLVEGR